MTKCRFQPKLFFQRIINIFNKKLNLLSDDHFIAGKMTAVKHIVLDDVELEIDIVKEFGDKRTPVCLVHHRTLDEPSEHDVENAIKVTVIFLPDIEKV